MINKSKKIALVIGLLFTMITGILGVSYVQTIDATKETRSAGANDDALNKKIHDRLNANALVPGYADSWQEYLDQEFEKVEGNFNWNMSTGVTPWDGTFSLEQTGDPTTNPNVMPTKNADGFAEIYFPEQLRAVKTMDFLYTPLKIKLMQDIDLAGYQIDGTSLSNWDLANAVIDGNGKTIYNLGTTKSLFKSLTNTTIENLTFDSAKLVGSDALLGIIGESKTGANNNKVSNLVVKNSIFFSTMETYNVSYVAPIAYAKHINASNIQSMNNVVYAYQSHAGGTFGITDDAVIDNSYSIDSTVIAGGDHSGGFISCSDGNITVDNSFTNNTVYGNKQTGVFIGAIFPQTSGTTSSFTNCFSSGTIEGTNELGGFIGTIQPEDPRYVTNYKFNAKKCYSTSIVGMRNGGTNLGGFIGAIAGHNTPYTFEDCFAAGEVGSIDTDVDKGRQAASVGGFVGSFNSAEPTTFTNCYYDKQTTAMREWATGDTTGRSIATPTAPTNAGSLDYIDDENAGTRNIEGIRGVLTSDSKKSGAGLASQPNANYNSFPTGYPVVSTNKVGFLGFSNDVVGTKNAIVENPSWVYDGGNDDPALHNCMYPQLKTFYDSGDPLIRAYSYASVATVHEQVWDSCTHGGNLPRTTYDTVRDLTSRFTLTSYVDNKMAAENVNIEWKKADAKANLYDKEQGVIGLFQKIKSSKYNRDYWTADKFAPGTEWVSVNFTVAGNDGKTATGSRRLRIIPTSNIDAGTDNLDITVGSKYNHAKDSYYAYSTGLRMSANANDLTIGAYPDATPFDTADPRYTLVPDRELANKTKLYDLFATYDDEYQVSAEFMSDVKTGIEKPHKDNIINVYVYDVKKFQELSGTDIVEIIYIEDGKTKDESTVLSPTLLSDPDADPVRKEKAKEWAKKFNGNESFENADAGRYLVEYEWIRTDGRFARDAKMLLVQPKEHIVQLEVKNFANSTINSSSLKLSAVEFAGGATRPNTDFTANPVSKLQKTIPHFKAVDLAFKKTNADAEIKKIDFTITTNDLSGKLQEQIVTIDDVKVDQPFNVPIKYFYSSYEEGGKYYAKEVTTDREYTLKYDAAGDYYYLTMNNSFNDKETGLSRSDLESDVKVTIFVEDAKAPSTGSVTVTNKTFNNGTESHVDDTISYVIKDKDGNVVEPEFSLNSKTNNSKAIAGLEVGTYSIERKDSTKYSLKNIMVGSTEITTSSANFEIVADGNTQIVINNERFTTGSAKITNKILKNNVETAVTDKIAYIVKDDANTIVGDFSLDSKDSAEKVLSDLEEGNYTIERVVASSDKYTFKDMSINGAAVVTTNPTTFTVEAGKETKIVVRNDQITTGSAKITNKILKNNVETAVTDKIAYIVKDDANTIVGDFSLDSKDSAEKVLSDLEEGNYTIERVVASSDKYTFKDMSINGAAVVTTNPTTFTVEAGKETKIVVRNDQVATGKVTLSNKTFENGIETNVTDTISYVIKDSAGKQVGNEIVLDSNANNLIVLPELKAGEYTIERKVSSQYTLKGVYINGIEVATNNTTTFSVVADANTEIVIENAKVVVPPSIEEGQLTIHNKTFSNEKETHVDDKIHYLIRDKAGVVIEDFFMDSNAMNSKQLTLPVGIYELERVATELYNLKDIRVDTARYETSKVRIIVIKNGEHEVVINNVKKQITPPTSNEDIPTGDVFAKQTQSYLFIMLASLLTITAMLIAFLYRINAKNEE